MFKDNPTYKQVFFSEVHNLPIYALENNAKYHLSRYIEAGAQDRYSAAGATKEYLDNLTAKMLERLNAEKNDTTLRTDMAVLVNNLRVRLRYPIDEDCALRTGAIFTFIEGEDPDSIHSYWINRKLDLCKGSIDGKIPPDPALYTFFLSMGHQLTPSWENILSPSETMSEYLEKRTDTLRQFLPA